MFELDFNIKFPLFRLLHFLSNLKSTISCWNIFFRYPQFQNKSSFENSIRHNLSLCPLFTQVVSTFSLILVWIDVPQGSIGVTSINCLCKCVRTKVTSVRFSYLLLILLLFPPLFLSFLFHFLSFFYFQVLIMC